jgi:hypothetical protein
MSKTRICIVALVLALAGSNGMWAYALSLYARPTPTPHVMCEPRTLRKENFETIILPLLEAISSSARPGASRQSVIHAVAQAQRSRDFFCMEEPGVVRVRGIGLKFDSADKLVGATVAYCPP